MKLKFQSGGTFVPPYVVYQPHIMPDSEGIQHGSKTGKKEKSSSEMKDIFKLLEGLEGLPGDVAAASTALEQLFSSVQKKLDNPGIMSFGGTQSIVSEYMKIINLTSSIKSHAKEFEKARDNAVQKGSINEIAIDSVGRIAVSDGSGIEWITPEQYIEDKESYTPITNEELLHYRKEGIGGLTFDTKSLLTVSSSISMNQITDIINKAMEKLGTTTESAEGAKLMRSLQSYIQASDQIGSFKVEDIKDSKLLTENQINQAQLALQYIYKDIPTNGIALLKMKSDGTNEGAKELIESIVYSKLSGKNELSLLSKEQRESLDSNGMPEIESNAVTRFILGEDPEKIKLNPGSSVAFDIIANSGVMTAQRGNEILGIGNTLADIDSSDIGGLLDWENATFGGEKVERQQSASFIIDSNKIHSMDLPIDEYAPNEIIRPDFDLAKRLEAAEEEISIGKITDQVAKNEIYKKYKIPERFKDANGNYNLALIPMGRFARITGVMDSRGLKDDPDLDDTVVESTDKNLRDAIINTFKLKNKKYDTDSGILGFGETGFYKGSVYIVIKEDLALGIATGSGKKLNTEEARKIQKAQEIAKAKNEQFIKEQTYTGGGGLAGKS